jgi:vacuolar-type H+-ATPase subunit F/Vma7
MKLETIPEVLPPATAEEQAQQALAQAMEVLTRAKVVVITTDDDYAQADSAVAAIKTAMKRTENIRTDLVKPLNDTVKKINAGFKPVSDAYEQALDCYRRPMTVYQQELARKRREAEEAQRKAEAEARAKAEAELEAARKAREEAAKAEDPFEALLAEEEAAEHLETGQQAIRDLRTAPPVVPIPAKVTGTASRTYTVWDFEVVDAALVPLQYRPIDLAAIYRDVRAWKGETNIPGIRVFSREAVR